ncbi:response regulator [Bacillus sp. 1NLA3E]|nr:response regulator [Bacillus sp. 1NLA3E]
MMIRTVIVEDDPMVAKINTSYLGKMNGFQLVAAVSTVDEALPIIEKDQVDLILLDIYMPGEDGWSLLSKIRWLGQGIDVIIISAACDKESIQKGLRFGAVDYLIKPFEFERFQTALNSYKEEQSFFDEQEKLSQEELDHLLLHKDQQSVISFELPKGLTRNTLRLIWEKILENGAEVFSTDEMAKQVGISRVSMRKYLFFLADITIIDTEVVYGAVGRPIFKHRIANLDHQLMNKYLNG